MTKADVTRVARERGYNASDPSWLARSAADSSRKTKELTLVDLKFRGGRLVGLRQGRYDPRTKRIEYRDIDLCAAETKR